MSFGDEHQAEPVAPHTTTPAKALKHVAREAFAELFALEPEHDEFEDVFEHALEVLERWLIAEGLRE